MDPGTFLSDSGLSAEATIVYKETVSLSLNSIKVGTTQALCFWEDIDIADCTFDVSCDVDLFQAVAMQLYPRLLQLDAHRYSCLSKFTLGFNLSAEEHQEHLVDSVHHDGIFWVLAEDVSARLDQDNPQRRLVTNSSDGLLRSLRDLKGRQAIFWSVQGKAIISPNMHDNPKFACPNMSTELVLLSMTLPKGLDVVFETDDT